jgi:hypothetical protein
MDEIRIKGAIQEVNAWKRHIYFTHDGKDYEVNLYWDEHDGYELTWLKNGSSMIDVDGKKVFITEPEWATKYDENGHNSLSMDLDELSYEMAIQR